MNDKMNEMIDELAMISHEFRRPIETISKSAELVSRSQNTGILETENLSEIMDAIINSCHRLSLLTSQIMNLSQLESGVSQLIVEKLSIIDFIDELKSFILFYEDKQNIKFKFNINVENPYVICDFKKLERILLNLISNAVKYSRSTDRQVTVTVYDKDDVIYFSVKDKGIGIPPSEQEKIFKKFYRIENFNTRVTEGCGLGLNMVKGFTELLGGTVKITSAEGKGSEFIVAIPRAQSNVSAPNKIVEIAQVYQLYKSSVDEIFADI